MDGDGERQSECPGCKRLSAELEQLRREVELLRQALDESRRGGEAAGGSIPQEVCFRSEETGT